MDVLGSIPLPLGLTPSSPTGSPWQLAELSPKLGLALQRLPPHGCALSEWASAQQLSGAEIPSPLLTPG